MRGGGLIGRKSAVRVMMLYDGFWISIYFPSLRGLGSKAFPCKDGIGLDGKCFLNFARQKETRGGRKTEQG